MKLLIVGIDGGTADIFDAFDMPFWKSLRAKDELFDVTEDLNQRGWARMLTGHGAEQTGGLYMRPNPDQSFKFDFSYNFKKMAQTPNFKPIWKIAEDAGFRVGMMNVPTTSPAQAVNGFYVSGGGGGIFQGGLPENSVYPESDVESLIADEYIFDTRLGAQRFDSILNVCAHIVRMMEVRTKAFIKLAKRHEIDFGFVAYRATTILFFLAMSEIAYALRTPIGAQGRRSWSQPWLSLIDEHMRALDSTLELLFNSLQPDNHIITSDHSMVPWTHNIDFNGFLASEGFATRQGSLDRLIRNSGKTMLKPKFRKQVANVPIGIFGGALMSSGARLDKGARAFSGNYVYGIYVNDKDRFGGPVLASEMNEETDRVIDVFNWRALNEGIDMKAAPYRRTFDSSASQHHILPDITILQSGHAFPSATIGNWYSKNLNFSPVTTVKGVGGMHSGQKGRHPILMVNKDLARFHDLKTPADLRSVYKLTEALFGAQGQ